jgi:hypothetical protein
MTTFIQQFIKDNVSQLDVDFVNGSLEQKIAWSEFLRDAAGIDLSLGHSIQHNHTARLHIELSNSTEAKEFLHSASYDSLIGTSSVIKFNDTCEVRNNILSGKKMFLSNLDIADYHTIWLKNHDVGQEQIVFVKRTAAGLNVDGDYKPIGMEATLTGNLIFSNVTEFTSLLALSDPAMVKRLYFHSLSFCTVNLGLCKALVNDLLDLVKQKNMDVDLKLIEHSLKIYNDLWYSNLDSLSLITYNYERSRRIQTLYSEGKRMLASIIHQFLLVGDSRHTQFGGPSQRFRDAIVYATHRNNFYNSLTKVY